MLLPLSAEAVEPSDIIVFVDPTFEEYEITGSFYDGLAAIRKDGRYGYIDTSGNMVISLDLDDGIGLCSPFSDGLAVAHGENGKCGCINTDGKFVIPMEYDSINSFTEGYALFKKEKNGKYGLFENTAVTGNKSSATSTTATLTATPTSSTVLVNGESKSFDAYTINQNNYFKLRDLAFVLSGTEAQFEVSWDGANNAITLTSGQPYTVVGGEMALSGAGAQTAALTTSTVYVDGAAVSVTAYTIGGYNYFKLRDIGGAIGFGIGWDGASNTITIDTGTGDSPD